MRSTTYRHARELIKALLPKALLSAVRERRFFTASGDFQGLHLGKFASFAQAREFASRREVVTKYVLDHEDWAKRQSTIKAHDYPILYWLGRLLETDSVVVDLGGSIGVSYYAFRDWLDFPEGLSWVVCELPEPAALGRRIAQERQARELTFTTDCQVLDGSSILFTAGALQFIESPLASLLSQLKVPPRHIVINRLALCRGLPGFVTLQHTGHSVTPVRVDNFEDFVASMDAIGYALIDSWKNLENSLRVPGHDECALDWFHGMYFRLKNHAGLVGSEAKNHYACIRPRP